MNIATNNNKKMLQIYHERSKSLSIFNNYGHVYPKTKEELYQAMSKCLKA